MGSARQEKEWASQSVLGPLNEPEPSEETGPGSHFTRPDSTHKSPPSYHSVHSRKSSSVSYPTPPSSASPTQSSFHPSNPFSPSHRQTAFADYQSVDKGKGRQRANSLEQRFPGDMSHRPLDQIRKEAKAANRSPHLRKKHLPGADIIDSLDMSNGSLYHHEGPYDATLLSRNTNPKNSPVAAVRRSNAEALKATPRENIRDTLDRHVPLQGTATIPPGMSGMDGKPMRYEEGADLMREEDAEGGAYRRWQGIKYLPEDYKGKGEPSFTIERQLKDHKRDTKHTVLPDGSSAYEMQPKTHSPRLSRQRSSSGSHAETSATNSGSSINYSEIESGMRRSNTTGKRVGEGLKRRFDHLRRSKKPAEE